MTIQNQGNNQSEQITKIKKVSKLEEPATAARVIQYVLTLW